MKHYIHKALLEEHSEYFKKSLNGPWKEAEDKVVCLDDVDCHSCKYIATPPHYDDLTDVDSVSIFVGWLYTRKLPGLIEEWSEDEFPEDRSQLENSFAQSAGPQLSMLKAAILADRMLSSKLRQAIEHRLIDYFTSKDRNMVPSYEAVTYAFAHLPHTSAVLRLLIDAQCQFFREEYDTEQNGELERRAHLPNAFLIGVMIRYAKLNAARLVKLNDLDRHRHKKLFEQKLDRCDYHNHATEQERKECCY